uniref:Orc1-like AAA ATPase domain-containing protein n=1 Tax=Odontella aurita TaxID=265563 RepID=A0A7S4IB76_9STRA|mmetsp:Transcript_22443/g.66546  ORF Transcript_22443/g.66546 Transcript_22443/m.66546 type:complete len:978 (+) Transcript_22443:808-3741(+)
MTSVSSSCFESFPESSHSKASNRTSDREGCTTCRGRPHKQPPSRLDFRRDVLYGRQAEVRAVLKAYRRALGGGGANGEGMTESKIEPEDEVVPTSSVILISGYSGTGKTSLSKCLRRPVEQSGGKFIIGKFDQLLVEGGGEPYSAVASVFTSICEDILNGTVEDIERTRGEITSALGTEAGLLAEILPSLGHIVGEQPDKTAVGGVEAQNRLHAAFRALARSVCTPEAPAVIVLDDVQWADDLSLDLMRTLVLEEEGVERADINSPRSSLLLVLCYRDNEVDYSHPMSFLISDLRSAGIGLTEINVENLSREDTNQLLSDASHMHTATSRPLADIVYRMTQGNCFFVEQFLNSLCRDRLLYRIQSNYDSDNEKNKEWKWRWDEVVISSLDLSDNVVDLLADRIMKLTRGARDVLQVAACIGSSFDKATLQLVFDSSGKRRRSNVGSFALTSLKLRDGGKKDKKEDGKPAEYIELCKILELAVEEGLVDVIVPKERFKFTHDKIQQAAYSMVTPRLRASMHYSIGDLIMQNSDTVGLKRILFVATNQLNRGKGAISRRSERVDVATMNLMAGEKAMSSAAFVTAAKYLQTGIGLLRGCQKLCGDELELCLKLYNAAAEAEYINGNFLGAEQLLVWVFANTCSLEEKLPAHLVHIQSLRARMKTDEALSTGLSILEQCGEKFPETPGKASILSSFGKTKYMLRGKSREELSALPVMKNENATAVMLVMNAIISMAYHGKPNLFPLIALRMVQLSVRHGLHRTSAVGFATYGMLLCGHLRDVKRGNYFGDLALSVVARFRANELLAQVSMIVCSFCKHQKYNIGLSMEPLLMGYRVGMQVGDVQWGLACAHQYCMAALHSGKSLVSLHAEMMTLLHQMKHHKQDMSHFMLLPSVQYVKNLLGGSKYPTEMTGEVMNEEEFLFRCTADNGTPVLSCLMLVYKMKLAYLFGDIELAAKAAKRTRQISSLAPAAYEVYNQAFF